MSAADVEREFVARGFILRERMPDECEFVTRYTVERDGIQSTFRITDGLLKLCDPSLLVDKIEREMRGFR